MHESRRLLRLCALVAVPLRALLVGGCLVAVSPDIGVGLTRAQGRSLDIESFHADIVISEEGRMEVSETIRVRFSGSWNGMVRHIPVEYRSPYGANYSLRLAVRSVEDDSGNDLTYEADRDGENRIFRIYVPGANDATRTVVLRYSVANGLRFFEEHDELYWNVTGNDTQYPIRSASAFVVLPEGVAGVRSAAFTGGLGADESDARISEVANSVDFRTTRTLRFREGLTVVVGWNPGVVRRPTALDRLAGFLFSNFLFLVPLMTGGGMFLLWRRHGRDPPLGALMPEYEPPDRLTPAEVGTLFDTRPDLRDVTATIVDLGVRGYLVIEETEKKALFGLASDEVFTFKLVAPRHSWDELKPHERALMEALFSYRDEVDTEELENSFYKKLPGIKSKLSRTLIKDGHYLHHPRNVKVGFLVGGLIFGALVAIFGSLFLEGVLGQRANVALAAGLITALFVVGFGLIMPARTERGTRMLGRIHGFEEFLRRVESDRFDRVVRTPEMFERFLPYAMAFGVEKNWARAFADIYQSQPNWYRGHGGGFHPHSLANGLSRMSTATGAAMTTAPRSSSGSSGFGGGLSGGGGFSGGGFGGGGVGGF